MPNINGLSSSRLYHIYYFIIQKCNNKNNPRYNVFGAKGIKVCKEWTDSFINFYNWAMENGYREDLTLFRIDKNGNYEPNNCEWVDMKKQCNNRSSNHLLTYGDKTYTMSELAKLYNIKYDTLKQRLKSGWNLELALKQEVVDGNRKKNK